MRVHMFAMAALLAFLLAPSAALAAPEYIRCTVGWTAGSEILVIGLSSTNNQRLVDIDAAGCGFLISTGNWAGVNKFTDWDATLQRQCSVALDGNDSFIVWSGTDVSSLTLAQGACDYLNAQSPSSAPAPVAQPPAAPPTEAQQAHDAISRINAGPHGTLPAPQVTSRCSGSGSSVAVENQTSYSLSVYVDGGTSRAITISPHASANLQLPAGHYSVGASVSAPNVLPFSGDWNLSNCSYQSRFYIQ